MRLQSNEKFFRIKINKMLINKLLLSLLIFFTLNILEQTQCKEITCVVNGKRPLHVLNEHFISFSVDPTFFLNGFNISDKCIKLAQHLNPAFIRIAGPSTEFIQISTEKHDYSQSHFVVTPSMWESLNHWIQNTNLTPIFAINDKNSTKGIWEATSLIPFLNISEHYLKAPYFWQLGFDNTYKTLGEYKEDLTRFKLFLDLNNCSTNSKIIGSNFDGSFVKSRNINSIFDTLDGLEGVVDALIWEKTTTNQDPPYLTDSVIPIWLTVPKLIHPVSFSSALLWAQQLGDAAVSGYEVIFKQPRFHELFTDTPVYWISLLFKALMGQNVLEVKSNTLPEANFNIYAHCTNNQDDYAKQGAMTVLLINNDDSEHTALFRLGNSHPKSLEVQAYIVTSAGENSTVTYLNGEELTFDLLNDRFRFVPKLRRVRISKTLNLNVPGKTIGFFVLPSARVPVCIHREEDNEMLLEKNHSVEITTRNLDDLINLMQKERETDEKYYQELNKPKTLGGPQTLKAFQDYLINKQPPQKLEIIFTERPVSENEKNNTKTIELELTKEEIRRILLDRAKLKAGESNISVTSKEIEHIISETAGNLIKNERNAMRKRKRFIDAAKRFGLGNNRVNGRKRLTKRDINMELLSEKAVAYRSSLPENPLDIEATIRGFGETSEELLNKNEEVCDGKIPEVFAELKPSPAGSFEMEDLPISTISNNFQPNAVDGAKGIAEERVKYVDERIEFLKGPSDDTSIEDDLRNYHSFQENIKYETVKPQGFANKELWEMDRTSRGSQLESNDLATIIKEGRLMLNGTEGNSSRKKRDLIAAAVTNEDIKNYKKFMMEQLKVMKRAKSSNKDLNYETNSLNKDRYSTPVLEQRGNDFSLNLLGKPSSSSVIIEHPDKKGKQLQKIKQRFQKRRRLARNGIRERKGRHVLVNKLKRNKRHVYMATGSDNAENKLQKNVWKPEDIVNVKKNPSYSVEFLDNREFSQRKAPVFQKSLKTLQKRHVAVSSDENSIDDYDFLEIQGIRKWLQDSQQQHYIEKTTNIDTATTLNAFQSNNGALIFSTIENVDGKTTQTSSTLGTENTTESIEENVTTTANFMNIVMEVVNSTIAGFVHLSEKLAKGFVF